MIKLEIKELNKRIKVLIRTIRNRKCIKGA